MDPRISEARDVALGILKPSQRDLDYGLELHRQSLVCEAYGFAPNAAVNGDAMQQAVAAGASEVEIQDLVEGQHMTRYVSDPRERQECRAAWEAAGVTCILQNAGEEGQSPLRLIKRLAHYTYATDMLRDEFMQKAGHP